MKYVPFAVNVCIYEMLFLTCAEHTSTISPVSETQDYGYSHYDMLKVLLKFGASEMICVELRAKSYEMCTICCKRICM